MGAKGKTRASNIELLRILAAIGVITLHYNYGHALVRVDQSSINFAILVALEALYVCAVDLFVLISGYFSSRREKVAMGKPIDLICEVFFINLLVFCGKTAIHGFAGGGYA